VSRPVALCYIAPVRAALIVVLVVAAACHHAGGPPAPTTGTIGGKIRDQDTGTEIVNATIAIQREGTLRPTTAQSSIDGRYELARLPPGRYDVVATYAGVTIDVHGVALAAGRTVDVDLDLPLGRPEARTLEFGDPREDEIHHYRLPRADAAVGIIEGTVTETSTRERVAGAVVTASSPAMAQAAQAVTDDHGRFELAGLPPGEYSVSAYYTVARHGTIQVEHNRVPVRGGEAAVVPLLVETQQ
jgi:hypothetical protein